MWIIALTIIYTLPHFGPQERERATHIKVKALTTYTDGYSSKNKVKSESQFHLNIIKKCT